jgi:uncharacterized protein YkvS
VDGACGIFERDNEKTHGVLVTICEVMILFEDLDIERRIISNAALK